MKRSKAIRTIRWMQRQTLLQLPTNPRALPRSGHGSEGWTFLSTVTIAAIVSVLILVSVSRLRGFLLHENEQDALGAVRMVTESLLESEPGTTIADLVRGNDLERRLPDAVFRQGDAVMESHGYFFEIVTLAPTAQPPARGFVRSVQAAPMEQQVVRAWPCIPGETGTTILIGLEDGTFLGHPNEGGHWGGLAAPPPLPATRADWADSGWRYVR